MESPALVVVPPTPRTPLSHSPLSAGSSPGGKTNNLVRSSIHDGRSLSHSIDTLGSTDTSSTGTWRNGANEERTSSENTAVNIYDMYGGGDRDSYQTTKSSTVAANTHHTDTGSPRPSLTNGTRISSAPSQSQHSEARYSAASSGMESQYATPAQSPSGYPPNSAETDRSISPGMVRNFSRPTRSQEFLQAYDQDQLESQMAEAMESPAILINPPPRRSSRQSLTQNEESISPTPSPRPSVSSRNEPIPEETLSPTKPVSSAGTSATSSSGTTHSPPPAPSDLLPNAPARLEGEDDDAYFVRATYAALDVSGVRGDGYEEGEELTRARFGPKKAHLPLTPLSGGVPPPKELTDKERELLGTVDRYGFFSPPSDNRQVQLVAAPLRTPLSILKQRPSNGPATVPSLSSQLSPLSATKSNTESITERKREDRRIAKWGRMLVPATRDSGANITKWKLDDRKGRKLDERVYKGIPDRWRTAAWYTLIEAKAGPDGTRAETLTRQYLAAMTSPSTFDVQIDLDVPRTISGHVMFRTRYGLGQRSMFHVLHAFSLICSQCGYCQGMGSLAATLLCYMEPEKVYICLVRLHDNYKMHDIWSPGFPGLLEAFYVQEKIMQRMLPSVYAAFKKNMISTTAYAVRWYITLFANSVSYQTQLRLWDAYFLEGRDFMVLVAVAILWTFKDNLVSVNATFESILNLLSSFFVVEDEDTLVTWLQKAMADRRLRRDMTTWREEWKELVRSNKDKDVLL